MIKGALVTSKAAENYTSLHGWYRNDYIISLAADKKSFSYCIPLKTYLGIAFDYDKAIINPKIEVVCIRSSTDNNCFFQKTNTANVTALITYTKVVHLHTPLIDPTLKVNSMDVRIECEFLKNIPKNTKANCLIIHDEHVIYQRFANIIEELG